jgi:hypothetical protein
MELVSSRAVAALLDGLVYEKKQLQESAVELTVKEIRRFIDSGSVDFGGGELQPAPTEPIPALKRSPTDKYGWWELHRGLYQIVYNERLKKPLPGLGLIVPNLRLLEAGGGHACMIVEGEKLPAALLSVGDSGLNIKENARVSTLLVFESKTAAPE